MYSQQDGYTAPPQCQSQAHKAIQLLDNTTIEKIIKLKKQCGPTRKLSLHSCKSNFFIILLIRSYIIENILYHLYFQSLYVIFQFFHIYFKKNKPMYIKSTLNSRIGYHPLSQTNQFYFSNKKPEYIHRGYLKYTYMIYTLFTFNRIFHQYNILPTFVANDFTSTLKFPF